MGASQKEDAMTWSGLLMVAVLATTPALVAAQQKGVTEAWSLDGFSAPESTVYDPERQEIYVSNVVGDPLAKDGLGFISRVSPDGEMLELEWVTGFQAPKGLALDGATLYVADIGHLVAVDTGTGEVTGKWAAQEGDLLNDITIDDKKRIFVSGTLGNRIYLFENDALSVWLEDEALNHPNGLKLDKDRMLVAPWGEFAQENTESPKRGHLLEVDLDTKEVAPFGKGEPAGNLDGIEPDGQGGWLVTEFMEGGLFQVGADGTARLLEDTPQGSADLGFMADRSVVLLPIMVEDKLLALQVK